MKSKEIIDDIQDGIKGWKIVEDADLPVFYLYYYYPTSLGEVEDYQEWAREFIWNFKDGENTNEVIEQVVKVLNHFFLKETLSSLTFVCIPASTEEKNQIRYEVFSLEVAHSCAMWDGYDHVELIYDRNAKHKGGEEDYDNISFDKKWFKGKTVILFDDIITHGNSIHNMKCRLQTMGVTVIGAITLGRTVHHDCGIDPYDSMDLSVKKRGSRTIKNKVSSSAKESARLFKSLKHVELVAKERALALSTIYGHLFSTGTLDPHEFITQDEYAKAFRIYEEEYEHPSLELDKFLDVSAKAAFYYIRRESL